jgi:hypothetical protein
MLVMAIFISGIFFGMTAMAVPKFENVDAVYYAPYEGSGTLGECEMTIKNAGGTVAYNVTVVLKDERDVIIIQNDEDTVRPSVSLKIRVAINRSTANSGIKVTITYTYKDSGGKTVSNTEKMIIKPRSIIP